MRITAECHKLGGVDTRDRIIEGLTAKLTPSELDVVDESAAHVGHVGNTGGGHYRVRIVAEAFTDKAALARHRLVYDALSEVMGEGLIHALSMETFAPGESSADPS